MRSVDASVEACRSLIVGAVVGKPYASDLSQLVGTYQWAMQADVQALYCFVDDAQGRSLIAVGSGGSFTAAEMARRLHERLGNQASTMTPLHLLWAPESARNAAVLLLSAAGRNPDILTAFKVAATSEPPHLLALCTASDTPLARLGAEYTDTAHVLEVSTPSGKDGFLATNSLVATLIFLIRAYERLTDAWSPLPPNLIDLVLPRRLETQLYDRQTWVVLHGGWSGPAAIDIESKCTEAALVDVQIADYRNFAHGRHYWLASRPSATGVVALVGPDEQAMADRTLRLLPSDVPVLRLETKVAGPVGGLALVLEGLGLVGELGIARGQDPGRPSIPAFGRRLYHLGFTRTATPDSTDEQAAIRRKEVSASSQLKNAARRGWLRAYRTFRRRLERARFGAVVFDYDGTLCGSDERFTGPTAAVGTELARLLKAGMVIGVATGRGKSVRLDLQRLLGRELDTSGLLVGYYNGAEIAQLDDATTPTKLAPLDDSLVPLLRALHDHVRFSAIASVEQSGPRQLTISPRERHFRGETRALLIDLTSKAGAKALCVSDERSQTQSVRLVESGHSLDLLAPGVSKLCLVEAARALAHRRGLPQEALCIGDRGQWPGNDAALLSTPYSLSADAVSPDPTTCWNLAPAGSRGVQATLAYLAALDVGPDGARFRPSRERSRARRRPPSVGMAGQ